MSPNNNNIIVAQAELEAARAEARELCEEAGIEISPEPAA
jgi:hypothetical protein